MLILLALLFQTVGTISGQPPLIVEPQGNLWPAPYDYIRQTTSRVISCRARGDPEPRYIWTRNDTRLPKKKARFDSVMYNEKTGDLMIDSNFNALGNGDYQCIVFNKHGTALTPYIRLLATETHLFPGPEGGSVSTERPFVSHYLVLECKDIPHSAPPWVFEWERGKEPSRWSWESVSRRELKDRLIVDPLGRLHFLWVEPSDHNMYYVCKAKNEVLLMENRNTNAVILKVFGGSRNDRGPELKYKPDVEVMAGEDAVLMCIFTYYSSTSDNLTVTWYFQGKEVGQGYKLLLRDVMVPTATVSQEGEYLCEARLGSREARGRVRLTIKSPPKFILGESLSRISAPVGADVTFTCGTISHNSHADPTVWLVNAVPLLGCPKRRFECRKKKPNGFPQCLQPEEGTCDSVPDCLDDSDEFNCSAVSCTEGQVMCNDRCQPLTRDCRVRQIGCRYPDFTCTDKSACIDKELRCDGRPDCMDGSDETGCPNGPDIKVGKYSISSDRTKLSLRNVGLKDVMCVQCMTTNRYGTLVGNACLQVVYKIDVLVEPKKNYVAVPGKAISIRVDAKTDKRWQNQMKYTWVWYEKVLDPKTHGWKKVAVELPAPGAEDYFKTSFDGKNITIMIPEVQKDGEDVTKYDVYRKLVNRKYAVVISHQYDEITIPFEITGKGVLSPESRHAIKDSSAPVLLWVLLLVLASVVVAFVVCLAGVCYGYRNRGGDYYLDKKEKEAGHDPEQELSYTGFPDASRIYDNTTAVGGGRMSFMGTWRKAMRQPAGKEEDEEEEQEEKPTIGRSRGTKTSTHAPLARQITI